MKTLHLKLIFMLLALALAGFMAVGCSTDAEENDGGVYNVVYIAGSGGHIVGDTIQSVELGGDAKTVVAVADENYVFAGWSDGEQAPERTDADVRSDLIITARFEKITFTVSYATDGNGKVVGRASQTVAYGGSAVGVIAQADEGYRFVKWSDGVETARRLDKDVKSNMTVTAEFERIECAVDYATDGNGVLLGETAQTVSYGETATAVTAVPNDGYEFYRWSDGVETATRTDADVKSDIEVTAQFRKHKYEVYYRVNNATYGLLGAENDRQISIFKKFEVRFEENAPTVTALPDTNENGESYVFIGWSDGVQTPERRDTNITEDLYIIAYFGYEIDYSVNGGVGGRIEGETKQKLLPNTSATGVTAVPDAGYAFSGWSDLSGEAHREGDGFDYDYNLYEHAAIEYIAYFEPIKKTFKYDYGVDMPTLKSEVTLDRNDIKSAEFVVPKRDGYDFYGWYADREYKIKITDGTGRYMYGYAAFSLDSDTLYARWLDKSEKHDPHKLLLIFVDEIDAEVYKQELQESLSAKFKMTGLYYDFSRWIAYKFDELLNKWFADVGVVFEVDSYYTTDVITGGFSGGSTVDLSNGYLLATDIEEVAVFAYSYHNTLVYADLGENDTEIFPVAGAADVKNGYVDMRTGLPNPWWLPIEATHCKIPLQGFLEECKSASDDDLPSWISVGMHEFTHTAECYFFSIADEFNMHNARDYTIKITGDARIGTLVLRTYKPYLLGEFKYQGQDIGIPIEYWRHEVPIPYAYLIKMAGGTVKVLESDTVVSTDGKKGAVYGSNMTAEAIPKEGYRFVKWSDGVTTVIRQEINIIAYVSVTPIFEKVT